MTDPVRRERLAKWLPCLEWGRAYTRATATNDGIAAVIVTIMLIPQSLAYALLAGLPPEVGLYASIAPLVAYGIFGTSRALAVGPVAVVSLMTAAAAGQLAQQGTPEYYTAAITLALLSGAMLLLMGLLRLGFMANFLSHPVISGFITASGLIIAASQFKNILGIPASGHNLYEIVTSLWAHIGDANMPTMVIGVATTLFLYAVRKKLKALLMGLRIRPRLADVMTKAGPVAAVAVTTLATWGLALDQQGVRVVGAIPQGLPPLAVPGFDLELWQSLAMSALLISIVGFVESVSVAQTLAAKRRQRVRPDQELVGLGVSNISSAFTGGYPVTGGFSRSVVNFDAGAETPAAGIYTAIGIALATVFLTPLLYFLPKATLAATIIVAVLSLVDLGTLKQTWAYSKSDFSAMAATILLTLGIGVEAGIVAGVGLSILLHLYRSSRPHSAVVGQVPGTEHFRNVLRHKVVTAPDVFSIRVDESLYFANARHLEDLIYDAVASDKNIRHVVLMCPAVNEIDASALESLEAINERLWASETRLHLSEVKGPVMDRLKRSHFLDALTGSVFLTQFDAMMALAPDVTRNAATAPRAAAATG